MTILGAVIQPDRAVLWCDTEVYSGQRPAGEAAKMALSGLGIGVVGAGSMALIRQAARSVQASASIDKVERRLPAELRIRAVELAPGLVLQDESWCTGQTIIAAGFSPAAGRVLGWKFHGPGMFEPILVSRFAMPANAGMQADISQAKNIGDIVALARRQIELVRLKIAGATGGSLCVVEVTTSGLYCVKIPDFDVSPLTPSSLSVSCRELVPPRQGHVASGGGVGL